jgi:DNA-binding NarL/FixJ family response regulator
MQKFRILIVDDHTILRDGLQSLIDSEPEFEVVGAESNARDAIRNLVARKPDLVLMDLSMPGTSGVEAIAQIKRKQPKLKVVVLTFHKDDRYIHASLEAGADGYVLKDDGRSELFAALRGVLSGNSFLSPSICAQVVHGYLRGGEHAGNQSPWDLLTAREREVMKLIAEGYRTAQIADYLSLSPKTVEKHRTHLMRKLNLHSVSTVTAYAITNGFVTA